MAEEHKTDEQTNEMNDLQAEIIKLENEIAEIDEQLNGFKASHTTDKRRKALKDARYNDLASHTPIYVVTAKSHSV